MPTHSQAPCLYKTKGARPCLCKNWIYPCYWLGYSLVFKPGFSSCGLWAKSGLPTFYVWPLVNFKIHRIVGSWCLFGSWVSVFELSLAIDGLPRDLIENPWFKQFALFWKLKYKIVKMTDCTGTPLFFWRNNATKKWVQFQDRFYIIMQTLITFPPPGLCFSVMIKILIKTINY